jgi:hypothetical protein
MSIVDLIKDVIVAEQQNGSCILIFTTKEMYLEIVLDELGQSIKVSFIEDEISNNVSLIVAPIGKQEIAFDTNKTIGQLKNFDKLKNHLISQWSVGYDRPQKAGFLHVPTRTVTY